MRNQVSQTTISKVVNLANAGLAHIYNLYLGKAVIQPE